VRKSILLFGLCVLVAIPLVSCRTPSAGIVVEGPASGIEIERHHGTTITVGSKLVGARARVLAYNVGRKNDLLLAQITIQNVTRDDLQFEYRFRWHDKNRMELDVVEPIWVPVSISAKDQVRLNAIANNKAAEGFDFQIRFSRPSPRW
jgi:uncharacterized protein YcfL